MWDQFWPLEGLETKGINPTSGRGWTLGVSHADRMGLSPNKNSGHQKLGWTSQVDGTPCILSPTVTGRSQHCPWPTGKRWPEALHLEVSRTLPYVSFPLADFNLHPFPIIKHNHEYNSFQWSSLSPLSELLKLRVALGSPFLDWMFVFLQNSYVEILIPKCCYKELGRLRGYDILSRNGNNALIEKISGHSLAPSAVWGASEKTGYPGREPSPDTESASILVLGFPASRIVRNKINVV